MRLTDLDPRWAAESGDAPPGVHQGVSFLCPHCRGCRLVVFFDVPICGSPPADLSNARMNHVDSHVGQIHWHREGDSFENLTLTPSVDASKFGHWHGYITNGAIA